MCRYAMILKSFWVQMLAPDLSIKYGFPSFFIFYWSPWTHFFSLYNDVLLYEELIFVLHIHTETQILAAARINMEVLTWRMHGCFHACAHAQIYSHGASTAIKWTENECKVQHYYWISLKLVLFKDYKLEYAIETIYL